MKWILHAMARTLIFIVIGTAAYEWREADKTIPLITGALMVSATEEIARAIQLHRGWTPLCVYLMMGAVIGVLESGGVPLVLVCGIVGHTAYGCVYETCRRKWNGVGIVAGLCLTTSLHAIFNLSSGWGQMISFSGEALLLVWLGRNLLQQRPPSSHGIHAVPQPDPSIGISAS
jgi:hypothetical protein